MTLSGVRLLARRIASIAGSGPEAVASRTGGSCSPSRKMSVASGAMPPADRPPRSETWIIVAVKYAGRASTNTGR